MIRSFKVLIAGLIVLGFSIAILYANRPGRTDSVSDELVETTVVSPENEGKLVIVSGKPRLADGGVIADEEAGLRMENAVYYSRIPYQKIYVQRQRKVVVDRGEDKLSEDDDITRTEYYVAQEWVNADRKRDAVVSSGSNRYENPPKLKLSAYHASGDLRVAGFKVSAADVRDYIQTKNAGFAQEELEEACKSYIIKSEIDLRAVTGEYGHGMLSSGDEIGDVHVTFSYTTLEGADPVTVIGRQRGEQIVFEDDDLVSENERIRPGAVSKEEFLAAIASEDASSRMIGIVGTVLGAILLLLSVDWSMIPIRK